MRHFKLCLFTILMTVSVALGQLGTMDINRRNVSNPDLLRKLLDNRIGGLESEVQNSFPTNKGTGQTFYVDSAVGNDSYVGTSPKYATATLDAAIALCTASRGDIIYVMQGHSETMGAAADEVDIDIAGVTIIGLGEGELRPLFDYTGDVTKAFNVGADQVTIVNLHFKANVTDVNDAVYIAAGSEDCAILGCAFTAEAEGTDDFLECIDSGGAASDRLIVDGCVFRMGAGACNAAIQTLDSDYMQVTNNVCFGDYAVACLYNVTTASNHIHVEENRFFNGTIGGNAGLNAQPGIELVATTTGIISHNFIACNLATKAASVVAADCYLFENYYNEDESSAATGGIIGTASADD